MTSSEMRKDLVTVTVNHEGRAEKLVLRVAALRVVQGPDQGKAVEVGVKPVVIGTHPGCDLVLSDPTVSGRHAEVVTRPAGYLLRDLESRNGMMAGGWRVGQIYLAPGMLVRLGNTRLEVQDLQKVTEIKLSARDSFDTVLGRSPAMRQVFAILETVAKTDLTVLLEGETGTGKGILAEAVHRQSPRADGPFEIFDCGAVPPNLIESELFGHEKGAFTGATDTRLGAVERADGGTLFLDEIGELPLNLQPKLLRTVETRQYYRVGGKAAKQSQLRIIAATNHNLEHEVARGEFRQDLFYRLAVVRISVPPLRERTEDIPLLLDHFCSTMDSPESIHDRLPGMMPLLASYNWPGNVRELRNIVDRLKLLPPDVALPTPIRPRVPSEKRINYSMARELALDQFERMYITDLLGFSRGNVTRAAEIAEVSRRYFSRLMVKHGVQRSDMLGED